MPPIKHIKSPEAHYKIKAHPSSKQNQNLKKQKQKNTNQNKETASTFSPHPIKGSSPHADIPRHISIPFTSICVIGRGDSGISVYIDNPVSRRQRGTRYHAEEVSRKNGARSSCQCFDRVIFDVLSARGSQGGPLAGGGIAEGNWEGILARKREERPRYSHCGMFCWIYCFVYCCSVCLKRFVFNSLCAIVLLSREDYMTIVFSAFKYILESWYNYVKRWFCFTQPPVLAIIIPCFNYSQCNMRKYLIFHRKSYKWKYW